ncbi:hypothetical protein ACWD5V_15620 [Streptomyces sp. NPDC002523]
MGGHITADLGIRLSDGSLALSTSSAEMVFSVPLRLLPRRTTTQITDLVQGVLTLHLTRSD